MKSWKSVLAWCALFLLCVLPLTQAGEAARVMVASIGERVVASASGPGVSAVLVKDAHRVTTDCGKATSSKMLEAELKLECDCSKAAVTFQAPQDCDEVVKTKARKGYTKVWLKSGNKVEIRSEDCGKVSVDYDN